MSKKITLTDRQQKIINKKQNRYLFNKEKQSIVNQNRKDKVETQINTLDDKKIMCENERKLIEENNKILMTKRNSELTKNIPIKFASLYNKYNNWFILLSAITSLMGLCIMMKPDNTVGTVLTNWLHFKDLQYFFFGLIFYSLMKVSNFLNSQLFIIKENFKDKWLYVIYAYITLITFISIVSNFTTWYDLTHNLLVSFCFAVAFDVISLVSSTMYVKYFYMQINTKNVPTEEKNVLKNKKNVLQPKKNVLNKIERCNKTTKTDLLDRIKKLPKGIITPSKVQMQEEKTNYKNWLNDLAINTDYIIKNKNGTFSKIK